MPLLVVNVGKTTLLGYLEANNLTLKLYSNDRTPALADVAADYTEVAGGGYAAKTLTSANWTNTPGSPAQAQYNSNQDFTFSGATNAPSTVYGYFVVNGAGTLILAERFPAPPFTPVNGSLIRIRPTITLDNA